METVRIRSFSGPIPEIYGPEKSEYGHVSRSVVIVFLSYLNTCVNNISIEKNSVNSEIFNQLQ